MQQALKSLLSTNREVRENALNLINSTLIYYEDEIPAACFRIEDINAIYSEYQT